MDYINLFIADLDEVSDKARRLAGDKYSEAQSIIDDIRRDIILLDVARADRRSSPERTIESVKQNFDRLYLLFNKKLDDE